MEKTISKKTFNEDIVRRMLGTEEAYNKFVEDYKSHRKSAGSWSTSRIVTDLDRQILADFQSGVKMKELREKYGISDSKIQTSCMLAIRG